MGFKTKVKSLFNKGKNFATSKYFSLKKKRLLKKIKLAELNYEPFPFLIIDNFFDPQEFKKITLSESIIVEGDSDEELIDNLSSKIPISVLQDNILFSRKCISLKESILKTRFFGHPKFFSQYFFWIFPEMKSLFGAPCL